MKKKVLMVLAMVVFILTVLTVSVSAARVENYDDTFVFQNQRTITHYEKWLYNEDKSFVRRRYDDSITVSFLDKNGDPLTEVAMWEYDEEEGKYYSLVWYITDWEFTWEDQIYSDANVGEQTYPKYTSATYTLTSVRAVDLRYYTHMYGTSRSEIDSWKESRTLKSLEGIYYDINNTPDDTSDDLKLQDAVGIGRDNDNYGYFGYEAQFSATGNKIVVGNFRDCDFQRDVEGNYGTADTWSSASNLQCLWYPDTMLFMSAGVGPVCEVDVGDGLEILACQILRDNKRVKEIKLPNSLLYLNNEAFRGSDLTTLIIGESLISHGNSPFLWTGVADNTYISKNVLNETYKGRISCFMNSGSTSIIYFDGNLEQANAFVAKVISEDSNFNNKINLIDYNEQTERGELKNIVLFYNYNTCDAFYMGQHNGEEKIVVDEELGYLGETNTVVYCDKCKQSNVIDTIGALVVSTGYSYTEKPINGKYSVTQGYGIKWENIEKYQQKTGKNLNFGLVATTNKTDDVINPFDNVNKIIYGVRNGVENAYEIKISGLGEEHFGIKLVLCMYVTDGESTVFINNKKQEVDLILGQTFSGITGIEQ